MTGDVRDAGKVERGTQGNKGKKEGKKREGKKERKKGRKERRKEKKRKKKGRRRTGYGLAAVAGGGWRWPEARGGQPKPQA